MTHLLTIGAEYIGGLNLYGCAIRSADLFEKSIESIIPILSKVSLRGIDAKKDKIIDEILAKVPVP